MQPSAGALVAILALPFVAAAATPLVYRLLGEYTAYFAAAVALACFGLVVSLLGTTGSVVFEWIPSYGVSLALYVDGLALLIGLLASGVGVLIFTYSGGYMHGEPGQAKYYATLLAFMGSMLGIAFAADLLALFVFWEGTSVASFLLIGHYRDDPDSQYAARKSMVITVGGGLFLLVGFLLLRAASADVAAIVGSTFRLVGGEQALLSHPEAVRTALQDAGLFVPVLVLVGIGAAAKSAQVPLHIWLPNAMEAPTPVSAFLHSATMVKAGVYLVGRMRPLLLDVGDGWMLLFATLGLVTMTVTAVLAVAAADIKELLAYSTASHLGLIIAGFGIANVLGAETGAFHILNHAMFKAALFLVAGIVAHEAGTRALEELGGLRSELPVTAAVTVVAALGMAGVPPFNGFYSKEFLFEATYEVAVHDGGLWWLLPVVAVLGSVFTFLYSIRFLHMFFGEKPDALGHVHSPPVPMLAPPVLLAGVAGLIGLAGLTSTAGVHLGPLDAFVGGVVDSVVPVGGHEGGVAFSYYLPTSPKPPVLMSGATILLGVLAYPFYGRLRDVIRRARAVRPTSPNWYYDGATGLLDRSRAVDDYLHTGALRTYAGALFVAVSLLTLGGYAVGGVGFTGLVPAGVTVPVGFVLLVGVVAAVAVAIAPSHIAGVLTLSILGFMIAIFYILASAPDLALTQLLIETLVLVLFLLVLNELPAFYGTLDRVRAARDAVVAGAVGVTVFVTVLLSTAGTPEDPIVSFFVERAGIPAEHGAWLLDWGGGGNIVNVILVDFRAFDTMGEISVVAMAALSVLTVVVMRERGGSQ
ncbi:MAG: hydrogen gas-evolving membrane-bound hydrogenase subunit E [Haloarculaceae archaeon]